MRPLIILPSDLLHQSIYPPTMHLYTEYCPIMFFAAADCQLSIHCPVSQHGLVSFCDPLQALALSPLAVQLDPPI